QHRRPGIDGWTRVLRIYEPDDCDCLAGVIFAAVDPVVSCDLCSGRISHVVLELWADRTSIFADLWKPGGFALADGSRRPQIVRRWRRVWNCGDVRNADLVHRS